MELKIDILVLLAIDIMGIIKLIYRDRTVIMSDVTIGKAEI